MTNNINGNNIPKYVNTRPSSKASKKSPLSAISVTTSSSVCILFLCFIRKRDAPSQIPRHETTISLDS